MKSFTPASLLPAKHVALCLAARRWVRRLAAAATAAFTLALALPATAAYVLAPQYAGSFAAGAGADAQFHRIQNDWAGSAVLWDEANRRFGGGAPVGTFAWGTGLWGQVDWLAVQQAAAGEASAASGAIVQSHEGVLPTVNHGNSRYTECYSATWGPAALVPFFAPAAPLGNCDNPEAGDPAQQNWTARYSGFIRITDPGEYNFSVLHDDGFFFRLIGAGGAEVDIGRDFLNPRDRVGFDQNLVLDEGLYAFELGAWNRLGAGIVDLRWTSGCTDACDWTLVPGENLLSASQVPEPPAAALVLIALLSLWLARAGLPRKRRPRSRCSLPGA
ncbi:MAG: PEP-CTERM sorting domain-containing protein [Burkholderiales bacterium]|nr:PEP-CTERM sorting domain-containing protein [Burkholderiales bacterium]